MLSEWRAHESGRVNDAIAALRQYSLLRADPRTISVHRLVQRAVHRCLSESVRVQWVELALRLLSTCVTLVPQDEWIVRAALIHLLAAACLAEVLDAQPELRNAAWKALREQLRERFRPEEIKRHLNAAVDIVEGLYGRDHEKLVLVHNRLGGMMAELGQPSAAAQHYERAQAIGSSPEFRRSYDDGWKPMYALGVSHDVPNRRQRATGDRPVRILMVASEAAPFAKTGGLADVLGALPPALANLGEEVAVVLPRYRGVSVAGLRRVQEHLTFEMGPRAYHPAVFCTRERGVTYFLIDIPELFDRDGLYGRRSGEDHSDNHLRFGALCRTAITLARSQFQPDVIHAHDWQAALVPAFMKTLSPGDLLLKTPVVFTVHNLGYQGIFDRACLREVGLPDWMFQPDFLEFYGRVNLLKAGVIFSEHITTVSPTYAREIQQPEFGFGLDGLFRTRADALTGVLNGVDYTTWNPETDHLITRNYGPDSLNGKRECKRALLDHFGLAADRLERPLIGIVSRLAAQKGFDLVVEGIAQLLALDVTLVVLGTGDPQYEEIFRRLAGEYPDRIGAAIGFDDALAHRIEAGCDMFLMPSLYEPCGLNQIYSLRYGSVPIVRATGGLDDSVDETVGFKFRDYLPSALVAAVEKAVAAYGDRDRWEERVRAGMRRDYSWNTSAAQYSSLYRHVIADATRR